MAENENKAGSELWNLTIPPETIASEAREVEAIVGEIVKTYNAINDEIGVILHNWQGLAHDKHVEIFNKDATLYNSYMAEVQYDAFRLFVVSDAYAAVEQRNVERSGKLSSRIF